MYWPSLIVSPTYEKHEARAGTVSTYSSTSSNVLAWPNNGVEHSELFEEHVYNGARSDSTSDSGTLNTSTWSPGWDTTHNGVHQGARSSSAHSSVKGNLSFRIQASRRDFEPSNSWNWSSMCIAVLIWSDILTDRNQNDPSKTVSYRALYSGFDHSFFP